MLPQNNVKSAIPTVKLVSTVPRIVRVALPMQLSRMRSAFAIQDITKYHLIRRV